MKYIYIIKELIKNNHLLVNQTDLKYCIIFLPFSTCEIW